MAEVTGFVKTVYQNDKDFYSVALKVEGQEKDQWVNLGTKEPKFKGVEIKKGMTIKAMYDEDSYDKMLKLTVISQGKANTKSSSGDGGNSYSGPKDNTGMYVCHGITGAGFIHAGAKLDLLEDALKVHEATRWVQERLSKEHPDMSEYQTGNYAGNAVLAACKAADPEEYTVEDLYHAAWEVITTTTLPFIKEFSKDIEEEEEAPKPTPKAKGKTKAVPAKSAPKKAAPKKVVEEEEEESVGEDFDNFDDDIPFN